MQIGLFGDSFCCENSGYIKNLENHYDAKIVSLGQSASSIWDLYLNQFKELKSHPDVCIFIWTSPGKIYHKKHRNLNRGSVWESKLTKIHPVWRAAKQYYDHLSDHAKEELEYISFLHYFDNVILSQLPGTTKIIHLWSFGKIERFSEEQFEPSTSKFYYRWTNGVEVRPALASVSLIASNLEEMAGVSNHLDGYWKNKIVFEIIKDAIDNYSNGKLIDNTTMISEHWDKYRGQVIKPRPLVKRIVSKILGTDNDDPFIYI